MSLAEVFTEYRSPVPTARKYILGDIVDKDNKEHGPSLRVYEAFGSAITFFAEPDLFMSRERGKEVLSNCYSSLVDKIQELNEFKPDHPYNDCLDRFKEHFSSLLSELGLHNQDPSPSSGTNPHQPPHADHGSPAPDPM